VLCALLCLAATAKAEGAQVPASSDVVDLKLRSEAACINGASLTQGVEQLLGRRAVLPGAARIVQVRVIQSGTSLKARVVWQSQRALEVGSRELMLPANECQRLTDGIAFLIALELGLVPGKKLPVRRAPLPSKTQIAKLPGQTQPTQPKPVALNWSVRLGPSWQHRFVPGSSWGLGAGGSLQSGYFSGDVNLNTIFPSRTSTFDGAAFVYTEFGAALGLSFHWRELFAGPRFGAFRAHVQGYGVSTGGADAGFGLRSGLAMGLALPVTSRLSMQASVEGWLPLGTHQIVQNSVSVWAAKPGVSVALAAKFSYP